jgi:hypothetical protein
MAGVSPELGNLDDSLLGWVLKREACRRRFDKVGGKRGVGPSTSSEFFENRAPNTKPMRVMQERGPPYRFTGSLHMGLGVLTN